MNVSRDIVEFRNVSFSYDGKPALEDVNLTIPANEFGAIVGPNGGGKTTLLRLMLGLLKPDRGELLLFGQTPAQARMRVGYVPQHLQYDPQFPVTALDVTLMGRLRPRRFGGYTAADLEAARGALERMNLSSLERRAFSALSGGERQRALIARALACEPELLLLDEPAANVDPRAEEQLYAILRELNTRMAILMVSHDIGIVSKLMRSVICCNKKVVVHPTSELTGDAIRDIYAGDVRMVRHDHRCAEEGHTHDAVR
ncbi:ABC transporter ATP-binding protein [Candidatus Sumerlaeota bacterium]|nr:ABC transporter ATP-binding protein [Candidatus Sumerlaeota bacterium]